MISVGSIIACGCFEQSSWFMIMVKMCGLLCVCDFSSCGGICGIICLGWCIWSYQGHDMGTKKSCVEMLYHAIGIEEERSSWILQV